MGSQSNIEKAYIAGFLDGDGSIMLQLKKRSDTKCGYRFMATICLYQDTRHSKPLHWMREALNAGYISERNDSITELRINGFLKVQTILTELKPFIRFKRLQTEAMIRACRILNNGLGMLSKKQLLEVVDFILIIQNANYSTHHKKSKQEFLKILGLTP